MSELKNKAPVDSDLKNPGDVPAPGSAGIILFDGECNLCSYWVKFFIRRDKRAVFKFASIQSSAGGKLYAGAGFNPSNPQTFLLIAPDGVYARSDAVIEIAARLGGAWRLARGLKIIPRGIRDWAYGVLARNRYKWFGKRDSCMVPTPNIKRRFLD
jgi:predicted DCC family thiol-disulfide oxidoreductase YuxK